MAWHGHTILKSYHTVTKYKNLFYSILMYKRSLYIRSKWNIIPILIQEEFRFKKLGYKTGLTHPPMCCDCAAFIRSCRSCVTYVLWLRRVLCIVPGMICAYDSSAAYLLFWCLVFFVELWVSRISRP